MDYGSVVSSMWHHSTVGTGSILSTYMYCTVVCGSNSCGRCWCKKVVKGPSYGSKINAACLQGTIWSVGYGPKYGFLSIIHRTFK